MKRIAIWTLVGLLTGAGIGRAQEGGFAERTVGLERVDGFIPFYLDQATGRLLFEIDRLGEDVLYYVFIGQAAGSVELGLDRGVTRQTVLRFERAGPNIHAVQQNVDFRAPDAQPALVQNVRDSFATSVLAALPIEAEEGGRFLVDATPLVIRDASDVVGRLRRLEQGPFRLDAARSSVFRERTKAFPKNTDVEVTLTYASDRPGFLVESIAPDPHALTIRLHHSFLEAPTGYVPRRADPRIGLRAVTFNDYGSPFGQDPQVRWITRYRLEKRDPGAAMSEPKQPIIYYLDPAIPEPTRSAMREGALWWNTAFEKAGFRNAFQVHDPPPDLDPMDVRHPYIVWINRDERGFSSSGNYVDPRTGEVIGAKVRMDSHRVRTVGHYFQAYSPTDGGDDSGMMLPTYAELLPRMAELAARHADGQTPAGSPPDEDEMVLARQAVLTAHELGHTLGFNHNWNSSINDRASVMEYPTPRVRVTPDGTLDLSEAFAHGVGAYDDFMVRYGYTEFPPEEEAAGLEAIIDEMRDAGILYTPNSDPRYTWYDDLATPTEYLRETMAARRIMLDHYGPGILKPGEPIGQLRDMRLWMVYLHHRWAIESGLKHVGGMYHEYVVKGDTIAPTEIVPVTLQREILSLLMEAIAPENLALSERLLVNLTPNPHRDENKEDLSGDYAFDHLRAARILTALVVEEMLQPDRAARLIAFADRQENALTLPEVLETLMQHTWAAPRDAEPMLRSLRRVSQRVVLDSMMILGAHAETTPEARAVVLDRLARLGDELGSQRDADAVTEAHLRQAVRDIVRYLEDPQAVAPASAAPAWGVRPRSRYPGSPGPPLGGGPLR